MSSDSSSSSKNSRACFSHIIEHNYTANVRTRNNNATRRRYSVHSSPLSSYSTDFYSSSRSSYSPTNVSGGGGGGGDDGDDGDDENDNDTASVASSVQSSLSRSSLATSSNAHYSHIISRDRMHTAVGHMGIDGDIQDTETVRQDFHATLYRYQREFLHGRIAFTSKISAILTFLWCMINLFIYRDNDEVITMILLFLISILIICKDLICCNDQSHLPLLLLFNFTVRFLIDFIVNFQVEWHYFNMVCILCILLFVCLYAVINRYDLYFVHWNLIRCHLFYRGRCHRWMFFAIYCCFSSLMILQLMDSVCLITSSYRVSAHSSSCNIKRIKFITCDTIIVCYCVMVLSIWNKLKFITMNTLQNMGVHSNQLTVLHKLKVEEHVVQEIFVFVLVFVITNAVSEAMIKRFVVDNVVLALTVILVLFLNFLMR